MEKNYTDYHTIEYPENSGKFYIFNPYVMGQGAWAELTKNNKPGKNVNSQLQKELNRSFFGKAELPNLYERFMRASPEERGKLKDISLSWLTLKIKATKEGYSEETINRKPRQFTEGGMYFYAYDAKHKDTLPMWDMFPLIILLKRSGTGFMGLNLHYLGEEERNVFLEKLISLSKYNKGTDTLLVNISYDYLNGSQRFKEFKPCIKKYLTSHVMSKILPIESHEWAYAASLSVQQFKFNKR